MSDNKENRRCSSCQHCLSYCNLGRARCGKDPKNPEWTSISMARQCEDYKPKPAPKSWKW